MNRRRFVTGVILLASSSIVGWLALGLGSALAAKFGSKALKIGGWVYGLSWIPFGIGFALSGREGVAYSKEWIRKIFRRGNEPREPER